MPFGAWTEEDWRLKNPRLVEGPYLIHDEASTPSNILLQAKAEARRMRSKISLSKASLQGKALSRGGPSLGSTHFSSRLNHSSTSIGELQDSVDTVQTLVSPFSSCDDDSELLLEHSEMILQRWKKEGRPKLWLADKILTSPRSDASTLTFDEGVDHSLTSASMVLQKVEDDSYGIAEQEESKFTVTDAVQLIAGGTVIGAVAEDMLRKLKNQNTGGGRSVLSKSYMETCERFGKLADKVKQVFEQMEEISKFEVEKANLRAKLRTGDVDANLMAKALGRENDQDLIAKIAAASEHDDDDDQIDGKEKMVAEIEAMLQRNDLALLLKEVLGTLERFRWQDLAAELRKWIFASDSSEIVIRRVIDESVELQREAIGVLTLSKFLAEETLSSHMLLAARGLADFHESIDREMKVFLEKCGLDDSITVRMLSDAKNQMLVEGYSTQKSGLLDEEALSGRNSRSSMQPPTINPSELTQQQQMLVVEREEQRRIHKRIMSDLYALVQEHKRKVELNRSLYEHMMMTTMRSAAPQAGSRPGSRPDGQSYLKLAMASAKHEDDKPTTPLSDLAEQEDGTIEADLHGEKSVVPTVPTVAGGEKLSQHARKRRKSITAGKWGVSLKKEDKVLNARSQDPVHKNARPHIEVGALRLLQSGKAAMDEIISKSAEKQVLEESALKYLKKMELQRRKLKNTNMVSLRSLKLKPKGSISDLDMPSRSGSLQGVVSKDGRRGTMKAGPAAPKQTEWLKMRREWLNKDLNEKTVKVSLEELYGEEKTADDGANEKERRGAETQALIAIAHGKQVVGDARPVEGAPEVRMRSRRRAVLMEQQTEQEEESFQAQVPRALLQDMASQRDAKGQAVTLCQSKQEAVAKKVLKVYGPNTWDYRLEAQYCIFFTNGWSMVLDRLEDDFQVFRTAIPLLDRLGLETRMEQLGEDLRECRDAVKELGRLQDEVRRKKTTTHSTEAEDAAALWRKKLDKQFLDLLKRIREWITQVQELDLSTIFEAKEVRAQRVAKLETDAINAVNKIKEGEETYKTTVEENEEVIMEKALLEHLVEHSRLLSRATSNRKEASQALKSLQKEAKEAGLLGSLTLSGSMKRSESSRSLRHSDSLVGEDGTGSSGLGRSESISSKSPRSPRSPRAPKRKTTTNLQETVIPESEVSATSGEEKDLIGSKQNGPGPPDQNASDPNTTLSDSAPTDTPARGGVRASVRGNVRPSVGGSVRGSLMGKTARPKGRASTMAKHGVNKAAGKLLEKGVEGLLASSGEEANEANEAFAKVLANASGATAAGGGARKTRSTMRGSKVEDATQMQGKLMMRKLQQKREELAKACKDFEGRMGRVKKEGLDTAAGWEERMKKQEQDTKTSQKMILFWSQKLVEWHEDVHVRCGEEVLEELLKLSQEDAANRDVTALHEALLRRAREEKAEIERLDEVQRSMKDRIASAVETGDISLFNLQKEVSNVISGIKSQNTLAVGNSSGEEEIPRALKPRPALTPQQKSGRPPRNKLTAVEEKRQQLAKLRMSQISAASAVVDKRKLIPIKAAEKSEDRIKESDEEHAPGVDFQVEAPEAPKIDPHLVRTRRSLFSMRRQLGEGFQRRKAISAEMGLLCRPVQAAEAIQEVTPPETDLLSLQQGSRPKVKPTLALNHKARQQRAKARLGQIFNATASEPLLAGSKGIRKLEELDRDSVDSGSDRLSSESSDDSRRERKPSNASVEDLGIWTVKTAAHRALLHLRSCRAKLIHRFGGVDKAYIRCVPALTGMTAEVFQQLSNLMGFTAEEATEMFDLMKSHRPPKKRRASATGARSFSKPVEQEEPIDRQEFAEVMRKATTVKGLVQLRRRLRMKHNSCEAATTAAFGKRQALDRETFRDFMIQNGISGREAYHHFMKMSKHNEGGGAGKAAAEQGQEENPQVSRFAFLKTLLHAEGLEAAEAFRAELVELLFNRGGHPGLASDQRGRRTAAMLSQELLSGLSEGVDRVWDEVESPPVAKRRLSKSLVSQNRGNRTIQAALGITAAPEMPRRFSAAPGPGRRLSASGMQVKGAEKGAPMASQLKQELSLILSSQEQAVPEGGTSKHFNFNAKVPTNTAPNSSTSAPRRASFSGHATAAMLHAGAAGARRRSVDEVPPTALRRRSLAQPASGGLLLSGNHVNLEPQDGASSGSDQESEHLQTSHLGLVRNQRHSSSASGLSGISHGSRRSSLSSSSGMSDTSRHSSFSHHSETSHRLSIFAKKMHDETDLEYDKVLIKVFETLVSPKVDLWEPISRDQFVNLIKDLRLGEESSKAIFKLSARADGRSSPGDVLLRALGGFGRKYRKLRELLGLKVDFSSRQSSKRPSRDEPEVDVVEEAPKMELSLGIGISDDSELQEERKEKARKQLRKAVKKIGLTFHLSKSVQNEPSTSTSEKVPGVVDLDAVFSNLSVTEMKGSDSTPKSSERRASAVNQVALDLSMLGSKSTPRRRSSFSGYAVRRSSTTAFGETVTGRRMSFDGDGIFGQLTEPGEEEEETWDFDDAVWQSRASKDEAGAIPMASESAESDAISEPLKAIAEAEVRTLAERRKLFDGEALQFSMALEALQQACWTLQRSFKGSASRAFEYLANSNETLDDAELRDALTDALSDTPSLSIPVWQVEGMVQVLLRIDGQETLSKNLFQRALDFLQPCLNLSQLRTRLVARYGTMKAGLQVIQEGIDEVKALSVDQFEPMFLRAAGVLGSDFSAIFQEACFLGGTEGLDGIVTLDAFQRAVNSSHLLRSLQLWYQRIGGASWLNTWLSDESDDVDVSEVLNILSNEVIQQVTSLVKLRGVSLKTYLKRLPPLPSALGAPSNLSEDALQEEAALEAAIELRRQLKERYDNFKEAFEVFDPREEGLTLDEWEEQRQRFADFPEDTWALIYGRMATKQSKVGLIDFAKSLSLAVPVETLYALRFRCQKLHGSVVKAWSSHFGDADEVRLQKWQQCMLKMSIGHMDALQLFRLILTSPFHVAFPPSQIVSDGLCISRAAFLAAMRGHSIEANNTILELLQQTRHLFPVSVAFEHHSFPRHPLEQHDFATAVLPILQRCRSASQIHPSEAALREEGNLLFNYLDVYNEGLVMVESLLILMTSMQAAYLFTEDRMSLAFTSFSTPCSSIYRWKKRQMRRGDDDARDTVSTMPSLDGESDVMSDAAFTSRPTTMGSRGTQRLPGSRGRQEAQRPMTSPFEVGGTLAPLQEGNGGPASALSSIRSSTNAVQFAKKLQSKASARPGKRSTTAPSSSGESPLEVKQARGGTPRVPKLPALQEKQETEAPTGPGPTGFGTAPLVLGMKSRSKADQG